MDPLQVSRVVLIPRMIFSPRQNFLRDKFGVTVEDRLNKRYRLRRLLQCKLSIKSLVEVGDMEVDVSENKDN